MGLVEEQTLCTVTIRDRKTARPAAIHEGLSVARALELASIGGSMGWRKDQVSIASETGNGGQIA